MYNKKEVKKIANDIFIKNNWGQLKGVWGPYSIGVSEIWEAWSWDGFENNIRIFLTKDNKEEFWFDDFGKFCRYVNNYYINPTELPKRIFISYRRNDSADVVGRIYDRLASIFNEKNIFMDVNAIPIGGDFHEFIDQSIYNSDVLLVVIGPRWVNSFHHKEVSKKECVDFVFLEIESAIRQNTHIIPVIVGNATMPIENELPNEIKLLSRKNGVHVRPDPDFRNDIDRLVMGIKHLSNTRLNHLFQLTDSMKTLA